MSRSWRQREGGRIRPKVKKCINCHKRRVKYHHVYCERCWREDKEMRREVKRMVGII